MKKFRRLLYISFLTVLPTLYIKLQGHHKYDPIGAKVSDRNNSDKYAGITSTNGRIEPGYRKLNQTDVRRRHPGAFILGAGKCGTGALRWFLRLHPQIVTPSVEELWYYDLKFNKGEQWHLQQMPPSTPDQLTMETSPGYFHQQRAMKRITAEKSNHNARFVVILRDPIDRALSHFIHTLSDPGHHHRKEKIFPAERIIHGFERVALWRNGFVNSKWEPISYGVYVPILKSWLKLVPLKHIFVVDGTAFAKNPLPQLKKLEQFLGVKPFFNGSHLVYNETKGFYCIKGSNGKVDCLGENKGRHHPQLNASILKKLQSFYKPYNEELFKLLGQRFDWQ